MSCLVFSWAKVALRSMTSTGRLLLGWCLWPQIASTHVLPGAVVSGTRTPQRILEMHSALLLWSSAAGVEVGGPSSLKWKVHFPNSFIFPSLRSMGKSATLLVLQVGQNHAHQTMSRDVSVQHLKISGGLHTKRPVSLSWRLKTLWMSELTMGESGWWLWAVSTVHIEGMLEPVLLNALSYFSSSIFFSPP